MGVLFMVFLIICFILLKLVGKILCYVVVYEMFVVFKWRNILFYVNFIGIVVKLKIRLMLSIKCNGFV